LHKPTTSPKNGSWSSKTGVHEHATFKGDYQKDSDAQCFPKPTHA